jgi:integrase
VCELTAGTVHRHLQAVAQAHRAGSARTTTGVLSGMCAFAAQRDALERSPVRDAGPSRSSEPKKRPVALSLAQARQLRARLTYDDHAIHNDLLDFVGFMLATGARIGEVTAMRWDAVDLDTGIVEIRGMKTAAALRTVRLPSWCVEMLESRKPSDVAASDNRPVFQNSVGTRRDDCNTRKQLRLACARAGFDITSHVLRKTAASLMDEAGISARMIADQHGHARPSITQDVYLGRDIADTGAAQVLESLAM